MDVALVIGAAVDADECQLRWRRLFFRILRLHGKVNGVLEYITFSAGRRFPRQVGTVCGLADFDGGWRAGESGEASFEGSGL